MTNVDDRRTERLNRDSHRYRTVGDPADGEVRCIDCDVRPGGRAAGEVPCPAVAERSAWVNAANRLRETGDHAGQQGLYDHLKSGAIIDDDYSAAPCGAWTHGDDIAEHVAECDECG